MAAPATLPALLDTLTKSLSSALEAAPKLQQFEIPEEGISLLDVKNELLLSYLQNLVFLILLKLRQSKSGSLETKDEAERLDELVVNKLVELRLYLEKGARPLEDKLKYQIDKILRAADDANRQANAVAQLEAQANGTKSDDESESDPEEEDEDEEDDTKPTGAQPRANLGKLLRDPDAVAAEKEQNKSGVYRPPKISAVTMPTTERREKGERKLQKSHTLDEFIADEMSTAPLALPSIGTTIMQGGRKIKTSSERAKEEERRAYEEANFTRLPKETKKDRLKNRGSESRRMNYGGEEWSGLTEGVDRISKLTRGSKSGGTSTKALLEKSRKRGIDTADGPRGSGVNVGERYQKRLKTLEKGRGR
ncbi:Sas10/Utp3/C1D family-domain-containing protein [Podospora fimiseda]|uniref:Sas10/Utp3/C1D family-domain-containing protein n=1 Tax=Podospora fimiseda TaxID=252190 RepID=A0AAN7H7H2_9PEZI|nr:Sas10/Utp3/C1D family-domain-containing protein [Podospora fimiseda]